MADRWSDPSVLYLIQYILNSQVSHETGLRPFHAHFGTEDNTYLRLPEHGSIPENAQAFVRLLDEDLRLLWDVSKKHQQKIIVKRSGTDDPSRQNLYQAGDLVLFQRSKSVPLPNKLTMRYTGPFEVLRQHKNDVECRHLCMKTVHKFHVERLKLFHGNLSEAERVARLDFDQFEIDTFLYYRGNPMIRTTIEFYIRFGDGDERWVTWSKDLFDTIHYEQFCRSRAPLFPLLYSAKEAQQRIAQINAKPITEVSPGDKVFVDIRSHGGSTWYNNLQLPRSEELTYVFTAVYDRWIGQHKKKLQLSIPITLEEIPVDHYFVRAYGSSTKFDPAHMVLVDAALCARYPGIMPN